jgi:GTP pyrophosphokinase
MDLRAERGVAAHWSYKTRDKKAQLAWMDRMVDLAADDSALATRTGESESSGDAAWETDLDTTGSDDGAGAGAGGSPTWQAAATDPAEFLRLLQADLQSDEIFVFSPRGKVVSLPLGSGPLDFAYAIHTEVGHRCIGAKVNGRMVSLNSRLRAGDTIEILTSRDEKYGPRRDWMGIVHTPRARAKVRQWFNREQREDSLELGRDELQSELRREGVAMRRATPEVLATVAGQLHLADAEALFLAIAQGHVAAKAVAHRVAKELVGTLPEQPVVTPRPSRRMRAAGPVGVHVEGLDDVMTRLARCCLPVPGDAIVGFVTRGRGVSVHRTDCANAVALADDDSVPAVEVTWDGRRGTYLVEVEVKALDRSGLLADVTRAIAEHRVNITGARTTTGGDQVARLRFDIELGEPDHLAVVLGAVRSVESVYDAYRVLPEAGRGRRAADATGEVPVVDLDGPNPSRPRGSRSSSGEERRVGAGEQQPAR